MTWKPLLLLPLLAFNLTRAAETELIEPADLAMIRANNNFGFTAEEIQKYFSAPLRLTLDTTGLDRSLLKPVPPPGVHPRVLFNPEDIADIKNRASSTAAGRAIWAAIRKRLDDTIHNPKSPFSALYDELAAGRWEGKSVLNSGNAGGIKEMAFITLYEAFRCLIDGDELAGKKAAAVIVSLGKISEADVAAAVKREEAKGPKGDPRDFEQVAQGPSYEGTLGLMYDFAHGYMDEAQRTSLRRSVNTCFAGMHYVGTETLRALTTNTSNHVSWISRMIFLAAAIEGEPGEDPAAYKRCVDAMTGFVAALYENGESYEAWGKQFLFMEHLAVMAKRGKDVIAAKKIRNVFHDHLLHAMDPWGGRFTFLDSLGQTGAKFSRNADIVLYNQIFPEDKVARWVYRNQIEDNYALLASDGKSINTRHPFLATDALVTAIFANDVDTSRPWDADHAEIIKNLPLTAFSEDTSNLITRSSWSKDALWLYFLTRSVPGGHIYSDRSHFCLSGLGRYWAIYMRSSQTREHFRPHARSVVMINDDGPGTAPGKSVAFAQSPLASFSAVDLRITWDYVANYVYPNPARSGFVNLPYSLNEFRLNKSSIPWMDLPYELGPNWQTSYKNIPVASLDRPHPTAGWTKRPTPIAYAYRTAGLVRGLHPYTLIIDDIQRDTAEHTYTWNLTLANDLQLASAQKLAADPRQAQIIVTEPAPPPDGKKRSLLLHFAQTPDGLTPDIARLAPYVIDEKSKYQQTLNRLTLTAKTTVGRYKALLMPYREGDELPKLTWNAARDTLTVAFKDQVDVIRFTVGRDERTRFTLQRGAERFSFN